MQIPADNALVVYGEITVNGTLSGGGGNASLYSYGSTFTNNGMVSPTYVYFYGSTFANNGTVSVTGVSFNSSGAQTIQGTGPWTGTGQLWIQSTVSLANDLTFDGGQLDVNHTLATLDIGDHTFTFAGTSFINLGTVIGTGAFRTTGW